MNKSFSGMLVAALAVAGVLGTGSKADAALIIDFDNAILDGGTITSLGGGHYSGSDIVFDTIHYRDSTGGPGNTSITLGGLQCGAATTTEGAGAATATAACYLDFNTLTNTFVMTTNTGLYDIGGDDQAYTDDRGNLVVAAGQTVLSGSFTNFGNVGPGLEGNFLFAAVGTDTKNQAMLDFFGLPAGTTFSFANTEIWAGADGQVINSDLSNQVSTAIPEPATMMLLGTGLLAAFRARRKLT